MSEVPADPVTGGLPDGSTGGSAGGGDVPAGPPAPGQTVPGPFPPGTAVPSSGFSAWSRMMSTVAVKTPAAALRVSRARAMMRAATRR